MYDINQFSERLAALRMKKGVSARDMSLSIGQSANYINKIENKKTFPSMGIFFNICEYLEITPKEFFDHDKPNPLRLKEILEEMNYLSDDNLSHMLAIARGLKEKTC